MANFFEPPRYIAVEGPIRVGKSTLSRYLAEQLHGQLVQEPEENPFLSAFYDGESGAAFQAQFAFLIERYEQLKSLDVRSDSRKVIVTDYIFEKDKIFANLNLTDPELAVYDRYYHRFRDELPVPDLVIYLQASVDVLRKRLKKKNAAAERDINADYMEEIVRAYEHFFFHYSASDLLVVNTTEIDFVERSQDLQMLLRRVSEPIKGTQYFLPMGQQGAAGV
jgi:deoxyadenosine/deoxycytidine kinase